MGKAEPVKFTASLLYGLLQTRHTRDLLVGECPTGTAYAHGYGQLDAWAMKRSWTDPRVWGYEIKVTRSDFIRDAKWRKYLDYCTEFFFVTAPGICDPTEIPPEAGLLVAAKTGTRLFTKKHAPARAPDKDALFDVLKSLLINRAVMRESRGGDPDLDRAERMERLKSDMADRRLLAAHIHEEIRKGWLELRQQRDQAKREVERYEGFKKVLKSHGLDPDATSWEFRNRMSELMAGVPPGVGRTLDETIAKLQVFRKLYSKMAEKGT